MATRRARIKAIVNVPARRTKANEESANSKINNISNCSDVDKIKTSPSEKNESNPVLDVDLKECPDKENSTPDISLTTSLDSSEIISCVESTAENVSKEDLDASNTSATLDDELQNITNVIRIESREKNEESTSVVKSSTEETNVDATADKVEVNNCKNKEVGALTSPLKQRPRLFIRPSPKLVDSSGRRRFPSGTRHKTSSESEDDTRTRATIEDAESPVVESVNRAPNSSHEKQSKSQEAVATNSNEATAGETKKTGSRTGRQRAKNKENRASDFRRRLWQKMKKGNGSAPMDRTRLTMFDYIYYNPISNPMRSSSESSVASKEKEGETIVDNDIGSALAEEQVDDPGEGGSLLGQGSQNAPANQEKGDEMDDAGVPAPRVKVGPDGELILDEQSLVIETTGLKEGLKDLANGPTLVESSSFTNYATYSKRTKGHEWSENETLRFYRALNVVGTDFTLMQSLLFNKRSRRDLKNKFKREERRNPSLIEKALRYPGVFSNAEELQSEFAKIEPPEEEKTKGKGRGRGRGAKRAGPKSDQSSSPAKKVSKKYWLVDGNVSLGEDSNDDTSTVSETKKVIKLPVEKPTDSAHAPPPDVIYSVSGDEVMMASQEIVLTNEDSLCSSTRGGQRSYSNSEDDSDDDESVSSESQFLSRVLQPTRSGRIPKRREVNNGYQAIPKKPSEERHRQAKDKAEDQVVKSEPVKKEMKMEEIVCTNNPPEMNSTEDTRPSVSIEVRDCHTDLASDMERISGMEPGSLVVIATTAPDDPSRKVLEVFMVSPRVGEQDSILIPQDISSEKLEGVNVENEEIILSSVQSSECSGVTSVIYPHEGFESCSVDTNIKLQT